MWKISQKSYSFLWLSHSALSLSFSSSLHSVPSLSFSVSRFIASLFPSLSRLFVRFRDTFFDDQCLVNCLLHSLDHHNTVDFQNITNIKLHISRIHGFHCACHQSHFIGFFFPHTKTQKIQFMIGKYFE